MIPTRFTDNETIYYYIFINKLFIFKQKKTKKTTEFFFIRPNIHLINQALMMPNRKKESENELVSLRHSCWVKIQLLYENNGFWGNARALEPPD